VKSPNYSRVLTVLTTMAAAAVAASLALFTLASSAVAGSTDLVVTKTADTNDGACDADCSLREAIVRANSPSGADSIVVPPGTYRLTITGTNEDFAATGDLDIRRGVTIRGEEGARATIIDARGIDRVFHIPFQNTSTPFTVGIYSMKVTGGGASNIGGGIFHDAQGATLFVGRSNVSGNQAGEGSGAGGGIAAPRGPLNVAESTISDNRAPGGQGGGVFIGGTPSSGPTTIKNTTISGNQSRFGGGVDTYDPVTITDSTVAFNTAQQPGGGLHVSGGPGPYTLKNTIVSNNTSDFASFKNCDRTDFVVSEGNNLERGTSCGFTEPTDKNADPELGPLENNGGNTNTHALLQGSPAINAGGDPYEETDQRGVARPQGISNDIGAFERAQQISVVVCPTGGSDTQCVGTSTGEALVGRDNVYDAIQGGGGDDAYNGKGSCDSLNDASRRSSDRYLITVPEFCNVGISILSIRDAGGAGDVLDLSRFYASTDFAFEIGYTSLLMNGPGVNNVEIRDFFTPDAKATDSMDVFKFSDRTLTARQVRNMVV
jgi:CSLREA domain-containing protein